ncbi:MAG: OsmC family protein [Bacteroidetes bacterium]|nr:OsmC family protein [Bacteroidota bacterium]MBS1539270.1 OsmC family protein [Bacteroidota bacterium]
MVKIELNRINDGCAMEAVNESGKKILLDGSPADGGHDLGMRPMQTLLAAMGACSAIDVITILRKQREVLKDIKITVTGERQKDSTPSLYTEVHAHYKLFGNINPDKAKKAIDLSVGKYCSVAKTLEKTARVTHSFEIIN